MSRRTYTCTKWWLLRQFWGAHRQTNTTAALSYMLGEGYYLVYPLQVAQTSPFGGDATHRRAGR